MQEESNVVLETKTDLQEVDVLGVKIDPVTKKDLSEILRSFLEDGEQHFLATINPESVMKTEEDESFRKILNYSDLNLADGTGILWASKYLKLNINDSRINGRVRRAKYGKLIALWQAFYSLLLIIIYPPFVKTEIPERITGFDLITALALLTQDKDRAIYLLGGEKGVANKAKIELEKKYPGILIVGARSGFLKEGETEEKFLESINKVSPDMLIVALGTPKQEKWIFSNMDRMPSVKIAVGIGGALNFLARDKRRAPKWMRRRGLEWLFRFYLEPWRLPRIKTATFRFVARTVRAKLKRWYE